MVDSSVDALEAGEDPGETSASGNERFGVGPGIGVGVGQYGQFPPVKKHLPPSKFCPSQYSQGGRSEGAPRELSMAAGPGVGPQTPSEFGVGVGPGIGVGVGQYGQFPPAKKMIPPSKFCPSQYPTSPPYPQK
ncbi:hypothetical protein [Sorangium cellulosum]|nr:hypothetical protein [Sorangium cellulosum]